MKLDELAAEALSDSMNGNTREMGFVVSSTARSGVCYYMKKKLYKVYDSSDRP